MLLCGRSSRRAAPNNRLVASNLAECGLSRRIAWLRDFRIRLFETRSLERSALDRVQDVQVGLRL